MISCANVNPRFRFAEAHNCAELKAVSFDFIEKHFPQVCNEDEIYDLNKEEIIRLLSSEKLGVDSEFQVFQAAIRWIKHDIINRRCYVFEILKHIRLPLLSLGKDYFDIYSNYYDKITNMYLW